MIDYFPSSIFYLDLISRPSTYAHPIHVVHFVSVLVSTTPYSHFARSLSFYLISQRRNLTIDDRPPSVLETDKGEDARVTFEIHSDYIPAKGKRLFLPFFVFNGSLSFPPHLRFFRSASPNPCTSHYSPLATSLNKQLTSSTSNNISQCLNHHRLGGSSPFLPSASLSFQPHTLHPSQHLSQRHQPKSPWRSFKKQWPTIVHQQLLETLLPAKMPCPTSTPLLRSKSQ